MNTTIDKKEIEFFSNLSQKWWDLKGPFELLHKFADVRIEFILRNTLRIKNKSSTLPLSGLSCLDIGCGGGILSERLQRLGATVTGIDASNNSIKVARKHAKDNRLDISYHDTSLEKFMFLYPKLKFDLVIASEVIEHVKNRSKFLSEISEISKENSLVVITTINDTLLSIIIAKFAAEYIFDFIPRGTHNFKKFVSPTKLIKEARKHKIYFDDTVGFKPVFSFQSIIQKKINKFVLSGFPLINYGLAGIKVN